MAWFRPWRRWFWAGEEEADLLRGHRVHPLLVVGLVIEAIYLAAAVRLPWWRYGGRLNSWSRILGGESGETAVWWGWPFFACVLGILILTAGYLWGWRMVRAKPPSRRGVWAGAILFSGTLFWLHPITSDLFGYLSQAHLFTDLGANPLVEGTLDWRGDTLVQAYPTPYAAKPSVYGPAWVLLSSLGTLGKYDVVVGLLYLKGLALGAYLGCAWLVQRITREVRPDSALEATYLFAWNPLVLLMAVGGGHNDIVMMAAVLMAVWFLFRGQWGMAFGALTLSVWTKYVSVIFIPLFAIYAIQVAVLRDRVGNHLAANEPGQLRAFGERKRSRRRLLPSVEEVTERLFGGVPGGLRSPLLSSTAALVGVSALVFLPFGRPEWMVGALGRLVRPVNWQRATPGQATSALGLGLLLFAAVYVVVVLRYALESHVVLARSGGGVLPTLFSVQSGRRLHAQMSEELVDPTTQARFQKLMDVSFVVSLLAFVLGAARSQPWHLIWPAALAGLSTRRWAWPAVIGLSVVMLAVQVWVEWGAPGLGD
jgi:hypothetical protein